VKRPNILILQTDQQRWDALGANGNRDISTPNLDRLANQGVNFNRCFVQNPLCMPSRFSFLSGRYPSTLGVTHNGVPVPVDAPTLPRLLQPYGYHSADIGKLHFLPHANRDHREPHPDYGFDHLEVSDEPGCYEDAYRAWVRRRAPEQLDLISVGLPPAAATWQRLTGRSDGIKHPEERFPKHPIPFAGRPDLTHTAFVSEQTVEYLRTRRADTPFLCIAGFYSPHSPWVVPPEFLEIYDPETIALPDFPEEVEAQRGEAGFTDQVLRGARHGYYAMVSEVDHHVGRILEALDERGMAESTIVVFTSDHGDWLGEHLRWGKGYPAHDCISRVPCIVRWPEGTGSAGRTVTDIVEAVDVVPTLLECAGIQVPSQLQGRSLKPILEGEEAAPRDAAMVEFTGWKSLRTDRFRYIAEGDGGESLFDLEAPFGEYHDVAHEPGYADALADMRRRMVNRLIEMERPSPRTWAY
jgi:arylsulfatase A-like enzyme